MIQDRTLFYILVSTSFLESTSPLYTRNLVAHYQGNPEIVDWLTQYWQPEEEEHGKALKTYINAVWPELNWPEAYDRFYQEYKAYCTVERLQPTPALEMVARCVVEIGSATFYKSLRDSTREPILRELMDHMERDEVRHYKYFFQYFKFYDGHERNSKIKIVQTIFNRRTMFSTIDTYIAYKHAYQGVGNKAPFNSTHFKEFSMQIYNLYKNYYPYEMAMKMLFQPLGISGVSRKILVPLLLPMARLHFFRA